VLSWSRPGGEQDTPSFEIDSRVATIQQSLPSKKDKRLTVVTPKATLAGVAFLLSQNETQDIITMSPEGM